MPAQDSGGDTFAPSQENSFGIEPPSLKAVEVSEKATLAVDGAGSVIEGPSELAMDGWLDWAAGLDATGGADAALGAGLG